MIDYRLKVDYLLSEWCVANNVDYSDLHDEAFCVKIDGKWSYVWYCEDVSEYKHLSYLKSLLGFYEENDDENQE